VLLALALVSSQAVRVETLSSGGEPGLIVIVFKELLQPLRW
jgi:hypothetical protein